MKIKKILLSLFVVLFLIGGFLFSGAPAVLAANTDSTEILIGFEGSPSSDTYGLIRAHGWEITGELLQINVLVVTMPDLPELPGKAADRARQALEEAFDRVPGVGPGISFVEENGLMYAHGQIVPWGVKHIGAVEAHNISTGAGVGIAILDTGIDVRHEDLTVVGGYAAVNCSPGPHCAAPWDDDHGHGTHVAGTAAALNNNIGVLGTAPDVGLYAVKVLDRRGAGTWAGVAEGIIWAADQGIEVINMSLGGGHSDAVQSAVVYAYDKGSLLIASAGNSGPDEGTVGYPAAYSEVIAVSATDQNNNIASWSSRGEQVEFAAPGVSIYSTLPGNSYGTYSGTSMAAPHVSGVAAMVFSLEGYNTNEEVRIRLQSTTKDIGLTADKQGYGLVNAAAAVGVEPPAAGNIQGTVTDGAGTAIEGASVGVKETGPSTITGADGSYLLENVPAGEQSVTASADGYYSQTAAVTVEEDATVAQDFVLQAVPTYTITATAGEGGVIEPWGEVEVYEGDSQTFVITADAGYEISDVEVDSQSVGAVESYTFENAESDHTIYASFVEAVITEPTKAIVDSVAYTTTGGRNNDRHLHVTVAMVDDFANPVSGASVSIKLYLNGALYASSAGTTNGNGEIAFAYNNAPSGCYKTVVSNVTAEGLEWDGKTPENGLCK